MISLPAWYADAACSGKPVDWWFPSTYDSAQLAKHICRQCPVIAECLEHALTHDEKHGIWAATSEKERVRLRRRRRVAA